MRNPIAKPRWLLSPTAFANALVVSKLDGWKPTLPVRWLTTTTRLHPPLAHDCAKDDFDCLVQFRVDRLDRLTFGGVPLGDLLLSVPDAEQTKRSVRHAIEHRAATPLPDDEKSIAAIINIDAIYHASFVALPYQWRIERGEVLAREVFYWELLDTLNIGDLRSQETRMARVRDLRSERIRYYATPTHAVYEVGGEAFWCEAWRRETLATDHQWSDWARERDCAGFDDHVAAWKYPPDIVQADTRRSVRDEEGDTLAIDRDHNRRLKAELEALGLVPMVKPPKPTIPA